MCPISRCGKNPNCVATYLHRQKKPSCPATMGMNGLSLCKEGHSWRCPFKNQRHLVPTPSQQHHMLFCINKTFGRHDCRFIAATTKALIQLCAYARHTSSIWLSVHQEAFKATGGYSSNEHTRIRSEQHRV